jgi:hypothetical protein
MINDLQAFVEKVDNMKKQNLADLSSDQDLSIAIMNLISIEEHFFFSGAKTKKDKFYEMIEPIREMRKVLLEKIITEYEGEVWCISKHLLASCMRLMEVGTKQQSLGNKDLAKEMFEKAYNLYCLFWGLNMKIDAEDTVDSFGEKLKKASKQAIENAANTISFNSEKTFQKKSEVKQKDDKSNLFEKLGAVVKKALNCCRE